MSENLDVLGIGNAIVDVIARCDDAFLAGLGLEEDSMRLVDEEAANDLYDRMGPAREVSGGSAANTIAGLALLGCRAGFVGKVKQDQLGAVFAHDIRSLGIEFDSQPATEGASTACCLILVPPSARRVMSTFLGAAQGLTPDDLDTRQIARSAITFIEGYAWPAPSLRDTARAAMTVAHRAGNRVAFSLAADWIAGNPDFDLRAEVANHVDILFANEAEIRALTGAADFAAAAATARGLCELVVLTRSEKGAVLLAGETTVEVPAAAVTRVVDTTGAGDLFAAGVLAGLARAGKQEGGALTGDVLARAGRTGALCAAEVISHIGGRPEADIRAMIVAEGLFS